MNKKREDLKYIYQLRCIICGEKFLSQHLNTKICKDCHMKNQKRCHTRNISYLE